MKEQEQAKYQMPPGRCFHTSYSEAFKRKVVMEVENGILTKDQAKYRYGIRGNSKVLDWCRVMPKTTEEEARSQLERRVQELEKALEEATTKVEVYEALLAVAKEKTGIDIKKNFGTLPSGASEGDPPGPQQGKP